MMMSLSRQALIAAALLGMAACSPVAMPAPASVQDTATPLALEQPVATATPLEPEQPAVPATPLQPEEPAEPAASPTPVPLPELELVTPKPSPVLPAPEAATPVTPPQEVPMPKPPVVTDPVAFAIDDLAARLSVAADAIALVRVEEVDWPDGSLGCPQPDMRYTQALVNGSFIQLSVDGQLYNYHSGGRRAPFLCTSKNEVLPEDLPGELRGDPNV